MRPAIVLTVLLLVAVTVQSRRQRPRKPNVPLQHISDIDDLYQKLCNSRGLVGIGSLTRGCRFNNVWKFYFHFARRLCFLGNARSILARLGKGRICRKIARNNVRGCPVVTYLEQFCKATIAPTTAPPAPPTAAPTTAPPTPQPTTAPPTPPLPTTAPPTPQPTTPLSGGGK